MKIRLFVLPALLCNFLSHSQIGAYTSSDFIPESQSVTQINLKNPNFNNAFVLIKSHGATTFKQTEEIILTDSKTFLEKKKIDFPKYKDYDRLNMYYHNDLYWEENTFDMDKYLLAFYSAKVAKALGIFAIKIDESLTVPAQPEFLFAIPEKNNLHFYKNDKKNLSLFTYESEVKKEKTNYFHYKVYGPDLKLIKGDSLPFAFKTNSNYNAVVYDNGFAVIKNTEKNCQIIYTDLKTKKSSNFSLSNGGNTLTVVAAKEVGDDKIIFSGRYSLLKDKKYKNGYFKAVVNAKTNTVEEQVYFDHVVTGESEKENKQKNIENLIITPSGAVYILVSQGLSGYYNEYDWANKFEIIYINSATEKWKKQLPIPPRTLFEMVSTGKDLFIAYQDYQNDATDMDIDNFTYGKPTPSTPVAFKQIYKANAGLIKVSQSGRLSLQIIPDTYYKYIIAMNSEFLGVQQGINGVVTSKCKFFRISGLK